VDLRNDLIEKGIPKHHKGRALHEKVMRFWLGEIRALLRYSHLINKLRFKY
jgi:hypothetical protein